ncbi:MAG: ABC transporter permease [Isosphaeraceae bacterium]
MSRGPVASPVTLPVRLARGFRPSAWLTLLKISIQQFVRGRRLLVLALLFSLPTALTLLSRYFNEDYYDEIDRARQFILFVMIPQALVPLTALVLASGMIRDEVEGQTLTYLLIRPLPRPSIYVAKLLAAWLVSTALATVFTTVAVVAIHWGTPELWGEMIPRQAAQLTGLSALSLLVYATLFGLFGLLVRWILPLGVAYILLFEGLFANVDFSIRRLTLLWYVRILAERWFGIHDDAWSIDLETVPSANEALLTLLTAALVMAVAGALIFGARELRVKTPEGS